MNVSMKTKIICFLLIVFCQGIGVASAAIFDHPMNASSKQDVKKSLVKMMDHDVVSGDFTQTKTFKKSNRKFVSTGNFRISKASGIVWKTIKPVYSELIVTDESVTERLANGQVNTISTKDNPIFSDISKTVLALLSGDVAKLESKFNIFYEKTPNGVQIGLVPREIMVQMMVANLVMSISSNLDRVVITDGEGSLMTFDFKNYKNSGKK